MRARILLSSLWLLLAVTAPAAATTYYVSQGGSDANSGESPADAWATIARVNSQVFGPGDQVLFEGGRTFAGHLYFDRDDAGLPAAPILVSSYGSGRATIAASTTHAILVYNTSGFRIANLNVVGPGRDVNRGSSGILVYTDLPGDVLLPFVEIDRVDASRFGRHGVEVGSFNGRTGFRDVRITRVAANENGLGGIFTYAAVRAVHRNVYVGYSSAAFNAGFGDLEVSSGNGINLSGVDGGTIEYSVAHDNGARSLAGSGPVGIWTYDSNNVVIQFSESYRNTTGNSKDGGGFHLDISTSNSVMQYNYSHDNAGAGYMLAHKLNDLSHTGNVIRWNVSQNDARRNNYASIHLWGRIRNAVIHNNTVFLSAGPSIARAMHGRNNTIETLDFENIRISNNIFVTTGSLALVDFSNSSLDNSTGVRLEGNAYWPSGGAFRINWRGTQYTSLEAFRAASGQETVNGSPVGLVADPQLSAIGTGPTFGNVAMVAGLWQYRLQPTSQLINAGIDLEQLGIAVGSRDYFGSPARTFGPDIGAHEFASECRWSVSPTSIEAGVGGGDGTVSVWGSAEDCGWAVLSSAGWLTAAPSAGSGPGSVAYTVASNSGAARTATLTVADRTFTVTQAGDTEAPPPPPPPPAGWSGGDIGGTAYEGSASGDGSAFTLSGAGADIWNSADQFFFLSQQVTGDFQITTRVTSVEFVHAWTKAGLMMRETLTAGARHASIFVTPAKGIAMQYRSSTGGASAQGGAAGGTAPRWIRLTRRGSTFAAFTGSADGNTWTQIGSVSMAMGPTIHVGLALTSHEVSRLATATFDGTAGVPLETAPPPPPPPSGVWGSSDIGAVAFAGSATATDGGYRVSASGADIWNNADAFHFVRQFAAGDWDVEATVASVDFVHAWTKAGVMIRESLEAGSKHAAMYVSPGKGLSFQYRTATNGSSGAGVGVAGVAPQRLRISRRGSTFTGYRQAADGSWLQVGTVNITMGTNVYIGLALTSHDNARLANAEFADVVLTPR